MSDRELDLTSELPPGRRPPGEDGRPFLGVHFQCCDIYTRVYLNRDATAYLGHCPKCARRIRFQVGPGGTDARFFRAS